VTEALAQRGLDLAVDGEAARAGVTGEDQVVVESHVEDATTAGNELGAHADGLLDRGRQTGGSGLVVSDDTVFDGDARHDRLESIAEGDERSPR